MSNKSSTPLTQSVVETFNRYVLEGHADLQQYDLHDLDGHIEKSKHTFSDFGNGPL